MSEHIRQHRFFFGFFIAAVVVYGLWWVALWPGTFTFDVIRQWGQAVSGSYDDASPFFSTWIMSLTHAVCDSPVLYTGILLVSMSAALAFALDYVYRTVPDRRLTFVPAAVYLLWPAFGYHASAPLKDVPFAILTLIVALGMYRILLASSECPGRFVAIVVGIACGLLPAFRTNGLAFLVVPGVLLVVLSRKRWREALIITVLAAGTYGAIQLGLRPVLDVRPIPMMAEEFRIHSVGAIYADPHARITPEEDAAFGAILPHEQWRELYTPFGTTALRRAVWKHNGVDRASPAINADPAVVDAWHEAVGSAMLRNPGSYIRDRAQTATMTLGFLPNRYKYQLHNDEIGGRPAFPKNEPIPPLTWLAQNTLKTSHATIGAEWLFWAAWVPATLVAVFTFRAAQRRRLGVVAIGSLLLTQVVVVLLAAPAYDYRYTFYLPFVAPLIPALYVREGRIGRSG